MPTRRWYTDSLERRHFYELHPLPKIRCKCGSESSSISMFASRHLVQLGDWYKDWYQDYLKHPWKYYSNISYVHVSNRVFNIQSSITS